MTDTQREAFEAKFPAPVGVTLFGKEYVWFGGNDHGKTCDFYNDMWKAFQAGLEANTMQLQAIYDDMYRHKDIAQVAQKLFMLINGQAALAHSPKLPLKASEYIPVLDLLLRNGELADYDGELANRLHELKTYLQAITNRKDE